MKAIRIFLLPFLFVGYLSAQNFNRPIPPDLFPFEFEQIDSSDFGYYAMSPFEFASNPNDPDFISSKPLILDENGYVLWYAKTQGDYLLGFRYHANYDIYTFISIGANTQFLYHSLDGKLETIDTIVPVNGAQGDVHEYFVNSKGNHVVSIRSDSTIDLSGYQFNGAPGDTATKCFCYDIQEFDSTFNLVWTWSSCAHVHPSLAIDFWGYAINGFDYCHGNSIFEDNDGDYLMSFRHLNACLKISRTTGKVLWIFGGKGSDFTLVGDSGFSGQHDFRRLDNGNYSVFDNGNMATVPESRGVEYQLDTNNWTATFVRETRPGTGSYASGMGNYHSFEKVRLLNYGRLWRPDPTFILVDSNDSVLTRMILQNQIITYRSYLFRPLIPIPRPEVICTNVSDSVTLVGPTGAAKYLWSNGDTTQSITVPLDSTYQLYVPYGIGMVGSLPIKTSQSLPCGPVNTQADRPIKDLRRIGIFDLLGREVTSPRANQIYIEVYSDGSTKRVIRLN